MPGEKADQRVLRNGSVIQPGISNPLPVARPIIRSSGGTVRQFFLVNPVKLPVEDEISSIGSELRNLSRTEVQRVNIVFLHKSDVVTCGRECGFFFALRIVCQPLRLACSNIKQPEIVSALEKNLIAG